MGSSGGQYSERQQSNTRNPFGSGGPIRLPFRPMGNTNRQNSERPPERGVIGYGGSIGGPSQSNNQNFPLTQIPKQMTLISLKALTNVAKKADLLYERIAGIFKGIAYRFDRSLDLTIVKVNVLFRKSHHY